MKKLFLIMLCMLLPLPAFAADKAATIARIEKYLNDITTVTADFSQIAPDGNLSEGKFYMERPGKMRWEYAPPVPVLIVASGSQLVYYDSKLQQVSYVPQSATPAAFLMRDHITLDGDITISSLEEKNSIIRITLTQKDKASEGALTLEFSDKPLTLRNIVVRDAAGQNIQLSLQNAVFGQPIDKSLFIFNDPRPSRKS